MKELAGLLAILGLGASLGACSSAPKYEFSREGATDFDRASALSECTYQIRLAKADPEEEEEKQLLSLCMEGKGYRSVQVR